jgi:hypothetical protein
MILSARQWWLILYVKVCLKTGVHPPNFYFFSQRKVIFSTTISFLLDKPLKRIYVPRTKGSRLFRYRFPTLWRCRRCDFYPPHSKKNGGFHSHWVPLKMNGLFHGKSHENGCFFWAALFHKTPWMLKLYHVNPGWMDNPNPLGCWIWKVPLKKSIKSWLLGGIAPRIVINPWFSKIRGWHSMVFLGKSKIHFP